MKNWLHSKLFVPFLNFLKQGISPKKLAWSVSIGLVLGISPLLGMTTLLGLAIALPFRLNVAAVQLVNYLVYPLQLLLLVPYFQIGAFLFGHQSIISSFDQLQQLFQGNVIDALQRLGWLFADAVFIWLFFALPLSIIIYRLCLYIFRKKFEIV